jgi:tetratricopeptide (TPR) repeat protein
MKLITTSAIALVFAISAAPAAAQYGAPAAQQPTQSKPAEAAQPQVKINPSKGAAKALSELQAAVQKNETASIPAKLAAAQAVATTKDDKYLVGRLQLQAAVAAKDNAAINAAIDAIAASNFLDGASVSKFYVGLGGTYYNEKQYAQAAAAYQRALALDPANSEAATMIGDALSGAGKKTEALAAYQRLIQASAAKGQKPDEPLFKRAVAAAYEAQSPASVELARQWVAAYPSAGSWRDAVAIYRNLNHPDVEGTISLYRLLHAAGALNSGGEYAQYARAAADQNNFNEAQIAVDAGVAAKLIDPAKPEYSDLVQGLKTKPKATKADLAEATKTAQSGMALLRIGDRYAAMGDYTKAVELYRMSMARPGVDAGVANLHIGIALARAGDKAGATTALNAVTGPRADIAKFWLTYLNTKG